MIHGRGPKPNEQELLACWSQFLSPEARSTLQLRMVLWVDLFRYDPPIQSGPADCRAIAENDLPQYEAAALQTHISSQTADDVQRELVGKAWDLTGLRPVKDFAIEQIWNQYIAVSDSQFAKDARNFFKDDQKLRMNSRARLLDTISEFYNAGHKVMVISHSFGTIVAYEAARTLNAQKIHTLVTMGSPLAWCYDLWGKAAPELTPDYPSAKEFPGSGVGKWWNIYDPADVIATAKVLAAAPQLAPLFQSMGKPVIIDSPIHNTYAKPGDSGSPHDYRGYLVSQPVRQAVRLFNYESST